MSRKVQRRLLRLVSRVPGAYSVLAFAFARRATVRGESMAPTLRPGYRLLADGLAYRRDRPRLGDIVLVRHQEVPGLTMVKRIAAIPGDAVGGQTLGRGEYWVLGDNAGASTDSRDFGPVKRRLLDRVWVLYWPTQRWRVF